MWGLTFPFLFLLFSIPIIKIHCLLPDNHIPIVGERGYIKGIYIRVKRYATYEKSLCHSCSPPCTSSSYTAKFVSCFQRFLQYLHKVIAMETSQSLSIESFSYSWLVNLKPSLESLDSSLRTSLDASDEVSFIEMDPKSPPSKRFFKNSQDSKFDFPISQSPFALVDADELFSNGYLMPLFVESLKMEAYEASDSNPSLPSSSHAPESVVPKGHSRSPSLKRCRTLSRRIVQKYLNFLRPLYRKLRGHKSGSSTEIVGKRAETVKNRGYYSETSPRNSIAYSPDDWRKSCDSESSIYEAVLHCKRSIGMHKFNMDVS